VTLKLNRRIELNDIQQNVTCLIPVRLSPRPSRSTDFADISQTNRPGPRDPKRLTVAKYWGVGTRQGYTWSSLRIKLPTDTKRILIRSLLIEPVVFCSAVVRGPDVSRKTKTVNTNDPKGLLFKWLVFLKTVSQTVGPRRGKSNHVMMDICGVLHFFRSYACHTIHSFFYYGRV